MNEASVEKQGEDETKLKTYLGFSQRCGKIAFGTEAIALLKRGAYLVLADKALGETSMKRLYAAAQRLRVPTYVFDGEIAELLNRPGVKAAALCDGNLAKAAEKIIKNSKTWKLYSGGVI